MKTYTLRQAIYEIGWVTDLDTSEISSIMYADESKNKFIVSLNGFSYFVNLDDNTCKAL